MRASEHINLQRTGHSSKQVPGLVVAAPSPANATHRQSAARTIPPAIDHELINESNGQVSTVRVWSDSLAPADSRNAPARPQAKALPEALEAKRRHPQARRSLEKAPGLSVRSAPESNKSCRETAASMALAPRDPCAAFRPWPRRLQSGACLHARPHLFKEVIRKSLHAPKRARRHRR